MADVTGTVLCGGQSLRMGRDKGLITENGKTRAECAASLLSAFSTRVVYSIHPRQSMTYREALPSVNFVEDLPRYQDIGPLGGLLSVHSAYPQSDILLLACDMTRVTTADLAALPVAAHEIAVYRIGEIFEPLCAYYARTALEKITALFSKAALPRSLQKILTLPELQVISLRPGEPQRLVSQNEKYAE